MAALPSPKRGCEKVAGGSPSSKSGVLLCLTYWLGLPQGHRCPSTGPVSRPFASLVTTQNGLGLPQGSALAEAQKGPEMVQEKPKRKAQKWSGRSPTSSEMVWEKPKKGSEMVWKKPTKAQKWSGRSPGEAHKGSEMVWAKLTKAHKWSGRSFKMVWEKPSEMVWEKPKILGGGGQVAPANCLGSLPLTHKG